LRLGFVAALLIFRLGFVAALLIFRLGPADCRKIEGEKP